MRPQLLVSITLLVLLLGIPATLAADKKDATLSPAPSAQTEPTSEFGISEAERVNVDAIKEKYWARGDESEMGVVQNRTYSKARKFDLGLFGGIVSYDPFLSIKTTGLSLGFHFNEYFSVRLLGWKHFVSPSSALSTLEETLNGTTTNKNEPKYFVGAEAAASVLYGKLSLVGKAILYYDFHLLGGAGLTSTDSVKAFTPMIGLGQQVFLSKSLSLRVDYRVQGYKEKIVETVIQKRLGQTYDRTAWSHSVTFGINYFVEFGK